MVGTIQIEISIKTWQNLLATGLVPFVSEIDEYIKDIAIDMGFHDENKYNININSCGVQVIT